jgi:hypothetical protein
MENRKRSHSSTEEVHHVLFLFPGAILFCQICAREFFNSHVTTAIESEPSTGGLVKLSRGRY